MKVFILKAYLTQLFLLMVKIKAAQGEIYPDILTFSPQFDQASKHWILQR